MIEIDHGGRRTLACRHFHPRSGFKPMVLGALLLASASALGATPDGSVTAAEPAQSLWDLLRLGGWAMWPLGMCSLLLLTLVAHVWRETALRSVLPARADFLLDPDSTKSPATTLLHRVWIAALPKVADSSGKEFRPRLESALADSLAQEEDRLSQWIQYLNVIASVSPMIGLLGTVSGMIGAFQTIARGGMGRPELLAGDIGQALVTTAAGLVIGIPAMIAFFICRSRLRQRMAQVAETAGHLIAQTIPAKRSSTARKREDSP